MRASDFTRLKENTLGGFKVTPVNVVGQNEEEMDEALKLDAPHRVMPRDELQAYAGRTKAGTKTKRDKFEPYIHGSNIKAIEKEDGTEWDLDELARQITTRPNNILGMNVKMLKSATEDEVICDITLPALAGIVVDEESGEFVRVQTCPSAGQCQLFCFARQGNYVIFPASSMSAARNLNFLLNDPDGWFEVLSAEIFLAKTKAKRANKQLVVRWHDAGDFFSKEYMQRAFDMAAKMPDIQFYAYTKSASVVTANKPNNFIINFSAGAKRGDEKKIEFHKAQGNTPKEAVVVPTAMFNDLLARQPGSRKQVKDEKGQVQFQDEQSIELFKQRLAQQYKVDPKTIVTYDQMMKIPVGPNPQWNVIIPPGGGDRAANRRDVIYSFIMQHK